MTLHSQYVCHISHFFLEYSWEKHLTSVGNPITGIRRSHDRFISTIGFPKPIDWYIYPFYGIQVVLHLKYICSSGLALVACTVQSRCLCQFWLSVNWIRGNKRQWNVSIHAPSLIQENAFENVVCKVLDILFMPHRVKSIIVYSWSHTWSLSSICFTILFIL